MAPLTWKSIIFKLRITVHTPKTYFCNFTHATQPVSHSGSRNTKLSVPVMRWMATCMDLWFWAFVKVDSFFEITRQTPCSYNRTVMINSGANARVAITRTGRTAACNCWELGMWGHFVWRFIFWLDLMSVGNRLLVANEPRPYAQSAQSAQKGFPAKCG